LDQFFQGRPALRTRSGGKFVGSVAGGRAAHGMGAAKIAMAFLAFDGHSDSSRPNKLRREFMRNTVTLIQPRRFGDARGWFSETYVDQKWAEVGIDAKFVQENQSYSSAVGTIRGIHFQRSPRAQAKLVRCVRGSIIDYAVDLRRESPTFGKYVSAELSAENGHQLFVPDGFGHAFVTTTPDCEVVYKVSDYYAPDYEGGIRWNCPDLNILWPLEIKNPIISSKDEILPGLQGFDHVFYYDGNPMSEINLITI